MAPQQQAYMKSAMPFAGVKVPEMRNIAKSAIAAYPFDTVQTWRDAITTLWNDAHHREERYVAIELLLAKRYEAWIAPDVAPLAEHLIVTGAWWDFVDSIAPAVFGKLLDRDRTRTVALLRRWSRGADVWKRRAAILSQLKRKAATDAGLLFTLIEPSVDSEEFFLRKAIGWALREYSKTAPGPVARYLKKNQGRLSALSRREASKYV